MENGIVFNIQKFSIHDGPGIRTTVFLKGCPLRCQWCSNPESQLKQIQIVWKQADCIQCQSCVNICPKHANSLSKQRIQIDPRQCIGCMQCLSVCPAYALSQEGERTSIQKIVDICLQDKDFYEESGGGVTISGGEGMSQPAFLETLVIQLQKQQIHTAIETTGYVPQQTFQQLAPLFDLLLFDIKHYDSQKHKEGTSVPNERIIRNLQWAVSKGLTILPRIPVIPDFNSTAADALGFVRLLQRLGIQRVQLLPFHQFGENKYELLQRPYLYKQKKALHPQELEDYRQVFLDAGIDCFF